MRDFYILHTHTNAHIYIIRILLKISPLASPGLDNVAPILISISQDVSIISVTEITDEVNRCYQPTVDEKYEEGGE